VTEKRPVDGERVRRLAPGQPVVLDVGEEAIDCRVDRVAGREADRKSVV
jgi:hypothetical protein